MAIAFNWHNESNNSFLAAGTSIAVGSTNAAGTNGAFNAGDVLIATVTIDESAADTINPPAGWTRIGSQVVNTNGPIQSSWFYHVCNGSETGSFTFTWTNSEFRSWALLSYSGCSATPIDASATSSWSSGGSTSVTTSSITPSGSSDMLVLVAQDFGATPTVPANMTQRVSALQESSTWGTLESDRALASSAAVSETFGVTTFSQGLYALIALSPASGAVVIAPPEHLVGPDQLPPKSQTWLQQSAPQGLIPQPPPPTANVWWFPYGDRDPPLRRPTVESPPALNLTPITLSPKVAGIGWFEPPDRDVPAKRITVESPASFTLRPSSLSMIAGIGWFEPPDRDMPLRRPTVESLPAIDLIPATLPPQVSGVAWLRPPESVLSKRQIVDDIAAWDAQQIVAGPGATWVNIANVSGANSGAQVTTAAINTTGCDLIVVVGSAFLSAPGVVTDNKGNTWHSAVAPGSNGRQIVSIFYAWNAIGGAGHTFTWQTSGGGITAGSIQVSAWSGSLTSSDPFDQGNSTFYGAGTTTEQAGSITPSQNDELIVMGTGIDDTNGSTFSIDSSFTLQEVTDVIVSSMFGSSLSTFVQSGAAAVNPTFTRTVAVATSRDDTALIASFKAAPSVVVSSVSGIAWFTPPDRDPAKRFYPENLPAWAAQPIVTPGASVSGIAWLQPIDELPRKLRLFPDNPPLPTLIPLTVNWEFFSSDVVWLRDPPIDSAIAFVAPAPPSPTVGISGIGWFHPRDNDPPPRRPTVEQIIGAPLLTGTLPAPPFGWFVYPDRDRPLQRPTIEQPPGAVLMPSTLPVTIKGIGWFEPADRDVPLRRPTVESVPAWDPQFVNQVVPTVTAVYSNELLATLTSLSSIPGDPPS